MGVLDPFRPYEFNRVCKKSFCLLSHTPFPESWPVPDPDFHGFQPGRTPHNEPPRQHRYPLSPQTRLTAYRRRPNVLALTAHEAHGVGGGSTRRPARPGYDHMII